MDSVFAELKSAREAKRLSLADISDATLVNIDFLRAIEQGKTDILPQTYIRAFMREYASFVGLDPAEIMRKYDAMQKPREPERPPARTEEKSPAMAPIVPESPPATTQPRTPLNPQAAKLAILGAVAITLGITLWNLLSSQPPAATEIPFDAVVKDNESRTGADTARSRGLAHPAGKVSADSLTLRAVTSDTVWMQLTIDAGAPREYLLRPNARISWKAKERFTLTVGNPAAVEFMLNQKPLGTLGKRGSVIRNMTVTRDKLPRK